MASQTTLSDEIIINGRRVATSDQQQNASNSNYILIRTTGDPLDKSQKDELKSLGVDIQEFVGNATEQIYLCGYQPESLDEVRGLNYIDYANVYSEAFAVPDVMQAIARQARRAGKDGKVEIDVLLHHDIGDISDDLVNKLAGIADLSQADISVEQGFVRITVDADKVDQLAAVDEVRVIHPVNTRKLFNNIARQILKCEGAPTSSSLGKGADQIICVCDTGFDKGSTSDVHDAFTGRVKQLFPWGRKAKNLADDPDGHGTHVCGSVLGTGQHSSQGLIQGTAPAATLIMQSTFSGFDSENHSMLGGIPSDLTQLFDQAYKAGARIHTNSWGTPYQGSQNPYDTGAEGIDQYVWDHQDMTILFAGGNDGQDSDLDGKVNERSLGAESSAKNCITVGASENNRPTLKSGWDGLAYTYGGFWPRDFPKNPLKDDHQANNPEGLAAFSSRGPTAEGRLKPDIVAPGTAILSARSRNKKFTDQIKVSGVSGDDRYMYESGTSMATPLVAGCCAVLREALLKTGYKDEVNGVKNPTGSLIKALLVNGADIVKGQYVPDEVGDDPNPHSGFGRVNLPNSVPRTGDANSGFGTGTISEDTGKPVTINIPIPKRSGNSSTGLTFKVTMAYADVPGGALSNDLDLIVVAGQKERHGNQLTQEFPVGAPSNKGFDRSNNVEQVVWANVPGDTVQVTIKHFRLMSKLVPFAYAWRFF